MLRILSGFLLLAWLSSGLASPSAICREEAETMRLLERDNDSLVIRVSSLRSLSRGEMIGTERLGTLLDVTSITSAALQARRSRFNTEQHERQQFEDPLCEETATALVQRQQTSTRLRAEYLKLMGQLLSLPDENLIQMAALQRLQVQLDSAHQGYIDALKKTGVDEQTRALQQAADNAVTHLNDQLQKLFAAFLFIEPPGISTLTPHADVMSLQLELPTPPPEVANITTSFQQTLYRTRISLTHARTRLHHQVWSSISVFTLLTPTSIRRLPDLLVREAHLLAWHIQETLLETRLNIRVNVWAKESSLAVLVTLFAAVGILLIVLLVYLAKRVEYLIYWMHDRLVKRVEQQRWLVRIANLLNTLAPLTPWILLLASLSWISSVLIANQWYAMLWILPLLRLVILFGLLALILEWLVFKIASTAGSFLNAEQSQALQSGARRNALMIVIPWSVAFMIDKVLGSSLLYRLAEWLALIIAYWRIGALLAVRKSDYIKNIEQVLTRELTPDFKNLLSGRAFVAIAPLLLPAQAAFFATNFLDRIFRDFDWYRRLSARIFWLRARYQAESQEAEPHAQNLSEDYRQWFKGMEVNGKTCPVIDTGLTTTIARPVDLWMEDHTNENTLMVTGEKGIGKSISLKRLPGLLAEKHKDLRVVSVEVHDKITDTNGVRQLIGNVLNVDIASGSDILQDIDDEIPPTLLILDECQNLFLGEVGGLDAWRELLDITNTRVKNIFWLCSMNNNSWAYLGNVFGRQYQMRNVIRAKRWSQNDIRSLILSRTHLSGYRLRYDDILLNHSSHQQNAGRSAEQRFFSLLWDSCHGIPLVALVMWLTAIRTRGKEVLVGLPSIPDATRLSKIGSELLFVYRAIITHENLTHEELLNVTQQSDNVVRYAIKLGMDIGFLDASDKFRYRITPLWYHTLVNFLARKNMIHE